MKRILIITYYWPPSGGSGVQRWLKFSKYLPNYGWQPIVYTPENPDFNIKDTSLLKDIPKEAIVLKQPIWEPYQLYRKLSSQKSTDSNFGNTRKKKGFISNLASWLRGNWFIPDPRIFWVKPSVKYLSKYIKENPVDAIITTGPPHSMHLIGMGLKKKYPNIKWLSDMRDPWANFDMLNAFNLNKRSKQKQQQLEQQVLNTCDAVIMVSPSLHEEFNPFDQSKMHLINNGFDHEDFQQDFTKTNRLGAHFNIYHTGLLNHIRNPEQFWVALTELCESNVTFEQHLKLVLIGTVDAKIKEALLTSPILKNKVHIAGYMAHDQLLKEYPNADLMLMVVNKSRNAKAQLTGKLYEYLAVGKPILTLGPLNGDYVDVLKETGLGTFCDNNDKDAIKKALLTQFEHFQQNKVIETNTQNIQKTQKYTQKNTQKINQYSRENLTLKLVNVLNNL